MFFNKFFHLSALLMLIFVNKSRSCLFLLNGGASERRLSSADRAERAELVLVATVLNHQLPSSSSDTRSYSVLCQVSQVLKGARLIGNQRLLWLSGFGSPLHCLSEAVVGEQYLFFLRPLPSASILDTVLRNSSFTARYDEVSGATAEYNTLNMKAVEAALGWKAWQTWTPCNASCGITGIRRRLRNCFVEPCDYGDRQQEERCSLWLCNRTQDVIDSGLNESSKIHTFRLDTTTSELSEEFSRLENASAFSISFEIQLAELGAQFNIFQLKGKNGTLLQLEIDLAAEIATLVINGGSMVTSHSFFLSIGHRHHFVITFNNNTASIFWDCTQLMTSPITAELLEEEVRLQIGPGFTGEINNLVRVIDEDITSSCVRHPMPKPVEIVWSNWSSCSVTCGSDGIEQRYANCRHGGSSCLKGTEFEINGANQQRNCQVTKPCPEVHEQTLSDSASCSVTSSFCLNGGICISGHCICPLGYGGSRCQEPSCQPPCVHGKCTFGGRCSCTEGWKGRSCSRRQEGTKSRQLGTIKNMRHGRCKKGCKNGGQCVGNRCVCAFGFRGRRCHRAICSPKCLNGGRCLDPNLCKCPIGYSGQSCEKVDCFPQCMNGGVCEKPGRCACKQHFYGRFCQRARCSKLCLNGGRCTKQGLCTCPMGFYGALCESRRCVRKLRYKTMYKPTLRSFREDDFYLCYKQRKVRLCRRKRWKSVVVYKIVLMPQFYCASQ